MLPQSLRAFVGSMSARATLGPAIRKTKRLAREKYPLYSSDKEYLFGLAVRFVTIPAMFAWRKPPPKY